ncbi:hypothetical protein BH10ACT1_BH10ACT1_40770 [soil metagenome]
MPFALAAVAVVVLVLAVLLVRAGRRSAGLEAHLSDLESRLAEVEAARRQAASERDAARSEVLATTQERDDALAAATLAEGRATKASARARESAERARESTARAREALDQVTEADRRSAAAEASVAEAATLAVRLIDDGSADPAALWALERARTERTWRHSVAAVHGDPSPLAGAQHPLWTALEIEVAAVREEVGAVVDLDVDLPDVVTAGTSLATLRVAQELLATAARKGEVTTLRVSVDGPDVVVAVESVDGEGEPIELPVLAVPPSRIEAGPGGVRLRGALAERVDQPT